jgi:ketosteroid isomerase-like protein
MENENLQVALNLFKAIEEKRNSEVLAEFYHPDVVQEEFPNRITPHGARRRLPDLMESFDRGKVLMSKQVYEVKKATANGDTVLLELFWRGELAIAFGTLQAGDELHAHIATVLEFFEGKIISQRNYDCFEPW